MDCLNDNVIILAFVLWVVSSVFQTWFKKKLATRQAGEVNSPSGSEPEQSQNNLQVFLKTFLEQSLPDKIAKKDEWQAEEEISEEINDVSGEDIVVETDSESYEQWAPRQAPAEHIEDVDSSSEVAAISLEQDIQDEMAYWAQQTSVSKSRPSLVMPSEKELSCHLNVSAQAVVEAMALSEVLRQPKQSWQLNRCSFGPWKRIGTSFLLVMMFWGVNIQAGSGPDTPNQTSTVVINKARLVLDVLILNDPDFPTVTEEQAKKIFEFARQTLTCASL